MAAQSYSFTINTGSETLLALPATKVGGITNVSGGGALLAD